MIVLDGEPLEILEVGRLEQFPGHYIVCRPVTPGFVGVLPVGLAYNRGGREY